MPRKYFIICLVCALWTIIQTSVHLVFVVFSYYLGICEKSASDPNEIFFYLTYLYDKDCSVPKLKNTYHLNASSEFYIYKIISNFYANTTNTTTLEGIVEALLERLEFFPNNVPSASRTSIFLLCFIILDGSWIVSAVSLLMGTCFGIKESLSLVFYGPWLVMTICVSIFDATATVFFGFDIAQTMNFVDWLQFVGISDPSLFSDLDYSNISFPVTAAPSLALCSVSSRFVLIWLSNWVAFIFVMKATISVYHESYKNEMPNRARTYIESPYQPRSRTDHDTSAARIRSWQLFYGAIDTNTTSSSSKSVESEIDLNSNSRESEDDKRNDSNYYCGYSDVAEGVAVEENGGCLEELRGQLPWSYTQPLEGRSKGEEKIELENMGRRHHRITSDSSSSGTEL